MAIRRSHLPLIVMIVVLLLFLFGGLAACHHVFSGNKSSSNGAEATASANSFHLPTSAPTNTADAGGSPTDEPTDTDTNATPTPEASETSPVPTKAPKTPAAPKSAAPKAKAPETINLAQACKEHRGTSLVGYKYHDANSLMCLSNTNRIIHRDIGVQEHCTDFMGGTSVSNNDYDWFCDGQHIEMTNLCRKRYLDISQVYAQPPPSATELPADANRADYWHCSVPADAGDLGDNDGHGGLNGYCQGRSFSYAKAANSNDPQSWKCWP